MKRDIRHQGHRVRVWMFKFILPFWKTRPRLDSMHHGKPCMCSLYFICYIFTFSDPLNIYAFLGIEFKTWRLPSLSSPLQREPVPSVHGVLFQKYLVYMRAYMSKYLVSYQWLTTWRSSCTISWMSCLIHFSSCFILHYFPLPWLIELDPFW